MTALEPRGRRLRAAVASTVIGALTVSVLVTAELPAAAVEAPQDGPRECVRAALVMAWDSGGPQVRAAAQEALLGDDAAVCSFVNEQWAELEEADQSILATQMHADGGPSVKAAATRALDASDPAALREFLDTGWQEPSHADLDISINQMVETGGAQLRAAATRALDTGTMQAAQAFLESGWEAPHHADLEVRVSQIYSSGGPLVRQAAQRAMDNGSVRALTRFLEVEWGVAAARDHERDILTDLLSAAQSSGMEAEAQTLSATEQAERAIAEAQAAQQAAVTAREAANAAAGDRRKAEAAAARAARAAQQAAAAAQQAVGAANDAAVAAQVASSAAVRVALAASLAQKKAAEASKAAAAARVDRNAADTARAAARAARVAAQGADSAGEAIQKAVAALNQVKVAGDAAISAGVNAAAAEAAAREAAAVATAAGADASAVYAAAERARAAHLRAARAADAAIRYANIATSEAIRARDAAQSAAANALRAAAAAEDAADHAGEAADAARLARQHAQAAEAAASASLAAAEQAGAVYDAAREADRIRLGIEHEQGLVAAREAARLAARDDVAAGPTYDQPRSDWRTPAINAALAVANDPDSTREVAVAKAREAALAVAESSGTWTREAARSALAGDDEQVLIFASEGLAEAEGMDDRTTLAGLGSTGTPAMQAAIEAVAEGTDAEVAAFLRNPDYPERIDEDTITVNRILAQARDVGDQHTIDAATHVLDDGSAGALRRFIDQGQYAAREADEEIKVQQIFATALEGSQLRSAAEIALEGPRAFRTTFLEQGRFEADLRDHDTAAHERTVASLVAQAEEAASRALENAQRAWEVAARAAGAADEAAAHAAAAAGAAQDAAEDAQAASLAAERAHQSATLAAASAQTAINAAKSAERSAESAARSAVWARISLAKAHKYANEAIDSANDAWRQAEEAGKSAIEAAREYDEALGAAYQLMTDNLIHEGDQAAIKCINPLLPGEFTPEGYNLACLQEIEDNTTELVEDGFDPHRLAYKQGLFCETLFGRGGPQFESCIAHVLSPTFTSDVVTDSIVDLLDALHAMAAGVLTVLEEVAVWRLCKGACKKLYKKLTGDVLQYDTVSEFIYWRQVTAREERRKVTNWQSVAATNWNMFQSYFENNCFVPSSGLRLTSAPKYHHCATAMARSALTQAGWTPRVYDIGGGFTASLSTGGMVHVMTRHMWRYFGTPPTATQTYFAPTDTIATVTGYLDRVVRHHAVGIREYLAGNGSRSQFTLEIDGHTYVLGLRRDGSIGQFYRT
ncbi:hypothetical protein [Promicromonospora sp. NPDC019610]|uniref:hypothetical protein n=1 Tax=Promicromonospora sp. NPDC019610 TaxID=3364405 RepID=UPI0037BD8E69